MIYFDNASGSYPKPPSVVKAVADALTNFAAPYRGAYPLSLAASRAVHSAREAIQGLFSCGDASHVIFTSGATEALNTAIYGLLTGDDHVITAVTEHNSVLRPLYRLGCSLDIIPCDLNGCLCFDGIKKRLTPASKALVVSHMSNVTGNIVEFDFISRFCFENGLYLILDCAQSAGLVPVNANSAHICCFSGHKYLFGPQGTGGMVINNAPVKPLKTGGTGYDTWSREQPHPLPGRLEAGTLNGHGLAGLSAGVEYIDTNGEFIKNHLHMLTRRFIDGVSQLPHIRIYGETANKNRGPIVSISVEGFSSGEISNVLASEYDIATRSGFHCAPLMHRALGTEKTGLVRFSFSYFNTCEEIDKAVWALSQFSR